MDKNEAIKIIRSNFPSGRTMLCEALKTLIPELCESEDEKIRKALKSFFDSEISDYGNVEWRKGIKYGEVIAWLEKQGEKKTADNIEQKFHAGDFITDGKRIFQIEETVWERNNRNDGITYCESLIVNLRDGITYANDTNLKEYHLWTIQDAKDGDVLATDNGGICIFDGTVEEGIYPFAYCGLTRYGFEFYDRKLPFTHDNNVYPATKEQRDLLFQKMKEAGYEWDNEKKELKKIEQKPAWSEENICYYDDICEILINLINSPKSNVNKDVVQKDLDWLRSVKKSQLKPAWSEEDEEIIKNLSDIIVANSKNNYLGNYYTPDLIRKLQSLRPTHKLLNQDWSEDDKLKMNTLIHVIANQKGSAIFEGLLPEELVNWLKSLKERMKGE